ncbi:MAG TPA: aminopeptidase [Cyclobacteriaceae bacterium]|nr:aminopeptidase [Cyclobacteriaceae bacterium]
MNKRVSKIIRKILLVAIALILVLALMNWRLIRYGVKQARGQLAIVWNARPVEEFLEDASFPDTLRQKLLLVEEVRRFAIDSLGLKDTKNYKTLFDQKGKEIMWVVTASEPFQLKPKEWKFPIVGTVPYKGYFDKDDAFALAQKLEDEGWDVSVRNPGGWSTLGWFTDPILSDMLEKSDGELASLIIHEMVHATIFVKDSVNFNENLASFIGDRGAEAFLIYRFGEQSHQFSEFIDDDKDYTTYVKHILHGTKLLDSLYQSMVNEPLAEKTMLKEAMIRRIVDTMDTLDFSSGKKPSARFKVKLPNNAYFMSFIHYQSSQEELWKEWRQSFDGNLKAYIAYFKEKFPFL